ncbi:MAG: PHP domain-containing protein, partial [Eubacteriales bacterium]|nr:PHP domain-containing protein [Eubacteriales bacterium]
MSNQDDILRKMNGFKIEHIKVFSKSKRVEITASSESLIPLQKIAEIENSITDSFDGCSVTIIARFTNNYSLSEIIEEYKESLVYAIGLKMPALKGLLDKGVWKAVDSDCLRITMPSNGTTLLRAKKSGKLLENLFSSLFDLNVKVDFDSMQIDEEYMNKYFEFKENEEQKVLSAIEADIISAEAADFEKQKKGSRKKGEVGTYNADGLRSKANKANKANKVIEKIKGNDFAGEIDFISDIVKGAEKAAVCGDVFKVDFKATKGKKNLCILYLTDYTSSIIIKYFYPKEDDAAQKSLIHEGLHLKVRGDLKFDSFLGETVIMAKDIVSVEKEKKTDDAAQKRVELHVHTRMSAMDGVTTAEDIINTAAAWGHKAVAITDHGVVQAFPEAYNAAKKAGIKVIYGVECYLLDDDPNESGICEDANNNYVVFDIETTGLYAERDKITEIGAVRIVNGEITQEFCSFVNPGIPIPSEITSLTGITDEMVADAPPIREVIKEFIKFAGESTLVAHNASFDISFIRKAAS